MQLMVILMASHFLTYESLIIVVSITPFSEGMVVWLCMLCMESRCTYIHYLIVFIFSYVQSIKQFSSITTAVIRRWTWNERVHIIVTEGLNKYCVYIVCVCKYWNILVICVRWVAKSQSVCPIWEKKTLKQNLQNIIKIHYQWKKHLSVSCRWAYKQ